MTSVTARAAEGLLPPARTAALAASSMDEALVEFDIPAQPLAAALDRYASLTLRPALFSSETVTGRRSSAIRGHYAPATALSLLLEGTGLIPEHIRTGPADAFVLKPAPARTPALQIALAGAGDYPGLMQARLWDALCDNPATRPGDYRALLRFEVDAVGQVRQVQLLGSTGNARRDTAVRTRLERVRMEDPPPAGMPQPLTMIVLPGDPGQVATTPRCNDAAP